MQDQAGFNSFPQAHFIGKQYPWGKTVGHLVSDIQLVTNQVDAWATQSLDGGLLLTAMGRWAPSGAVCSFSN